MDSPLAPQQTPEEAHLAEQERLLAELTEELATREAEFATSGVEFARFRLEYLRRFAPLYAEADRLEAEIARRLAQKEPTAERMREADRAEDRAQDAERLLHDAREDAGTAWEAEEERVQRAPDPELRDLYRQAAKQLHPDLAAEGDERARRTVAMAALNAAYERGDAEAVRRILSDESVRPEAVEGDGVAARLVRVLRRIAQVRARLAELDRLTADLAADSTYTLFVEAREEWLAGGDPLAEDETALRKRITSLRAQLAAFDVAKEAAS